MTVLDEHSRLLDDLLNFAEAAEWKLVPATHPAEQHLFIYWNIGAVARGCALVRAIRELAEKSLIWEGWILLRSLLELVAVQETIRQNTQRVVDVFQRGSRKQQRMAEVARKGNYVEPSMWRDLASFSGRSVTKLRELKGERVENLEKPEALLEEAGFPSGAYELIYQPVGSIVHSNPIILDLSVKLDVDGNVVPDFEQTSDDAPGLLGYTAQYLIGIVHNASAAMTLETEPLNEFSRRLTELRDKGSEQAP